MKIKLLDGRECDVLERGCKFRVCLRPGHATHYSASGYSGCSHWTDKNLSCRRWSERGCPPVEGRVVGDEAFFHNFDCKKFRYPIIPRTPRGVVKCMNCKKMIPKAVIIATRELGGEKRK